MRVTMIPIVIGALGTIAKDLERKLEELEVGGWIKTIQTKALLRLARLLRRVLETCCHSDSNENPSANVGMRNSLIIVIIKIWIETQVLRPSQRTEEFMEHESDSDTNYNWCTWNDSEKLGKGSRRVGNRRTNWDNPNYGITKTSLNTVESPGLLRKLAVNETTVRNQQLTVVGKNS